MRCRTAWIRRSASWAAAFQGEKQRIGLARMFLRDADLVLFDEPTSRLDAYNESVILGSVNNLAEQGSAVVLVSHRDSAMRVADRILRM